MFGVAKITSPRLQLLTPSPDVSPRVSVVFSESDVDEETMSTDESVPSRPVSSADYDKTFIHYSSTPYVPERPTLRQILANQAPPPWTLSAFTAYLSQNHCLENLEFTMDAERYKQSYESMALQMAGMPDEFDLEECEHVKLLWRTLMDAYIEPNGSREVNLPGRFRDDLLAMDNERAPPPPSSLDMSVRIIHELMDGSILLPFLNSVSPAPRATSLHEGWNLSEESLHLTRSAGDAPVAETNKARRPSPPFNSLDAMTQQSSSSSVSGRSAQAFTLPHFSKSRFGHGSSSSTGSADGSLTDDSTGPASPDIPSIEHMTPPTTPPSSDLRSESPRTRRDPTWKRMMRLGASKKKSASRMRPIEDEGYL
ncbi:hypothetical protein MMC25_002108 [Agyrium rufum]|nr:hypothetical protein [Agyrium rufum]